MKRKEAALIEALDRVGDFVTHNEPVVARALTDNARARLTSLQDRLLSHMKTQAAAQQLVRDRTRIKHELRRAVVEEHMLPITLLGQAELGLPATTFRVPSARTKFSEVVAAGYGLAEAAAKYKEGLVAAGLPEDFLERLVAATDALRDAATAKSEITAQSVEATALLRKEGRLARLRLRAVDLAIRSTIKPDQPLYDRWVNIRRVAPVPVASKVDAGSGETAATGEVIS